MILIKNAPKCGGSFIAGRVRAQRCNFDAIYKLKNRQQRPIYPVLTDRGPMNIAFSLSGPMTRENSAITQYIKISTVSRI